MSLFILMTMLFFLLRLLPGGPFDDEVYLAPEIIQSLRIQYGLNEPLWTQYWIYIQHFLKFDFGASILFSGKPVGEVILLALPRSFGLGASALFMALLFGLGGTIVFFLTGTQAIFKIIHLAFLSIPTLLLGPFFILIFCLQLNLFPIVVDSSWSSYIPPLVVLSIRPGVNLSRLLITALEESLSQPWSITARAYGFSKPTILMKFAMKQSLIPVLSYLGQSVAGILSGSFFVEMIFNINGLGTGFVQSILGRDYSLIMALTLMYGFILVIFHFIFDIIIYLLDPRIDRS